MKRLFALALFPAVVLAQEASSPPPQGEAESADPAPVETVPVKPLEESAAVKPPKDAVQLDTIQVTANKRVKAQRDIPGSVGAIRGQALESMRAQGMKDYLKLVPGVYLPDQGNEESVPVIRGIATSTAFGATAATTGIYMDEMPFADLFAPSSIPDLNPFDLDRVEVLKGPQGTLFGSGALAGAIRYIVAKPKLGIWEAKAQETVNQTKGSEGISPVTGVAANVPIGGAAAIRASGVFRKDAGLYDMGAIDNNGNSIRNDVDSDRSKQDSMRVLGSWNVTDDFVASGFWFNQKTHHNDFGFSNKVGELGSDQFPFASPREHDFGGGNLSLTYDFPWLRAFSSTNRMIKHNLLTQHQEFGFDLQHQNANEYVTVLGDEVRGWTQELRLSSPEGQDGSWQWLLGGSFLHYGDSTFQYSYLGPDMPDPKQRSDVSTAGRSAAQVYSEGDQLATEKSIFGEISRKLGERLELTLGGRKYETGLLADTLVCGAQITALFQEQCHPQHFDDVTKGFNPKASLRYLHDRNIQLYLLAAKGFQFGGLQLNPPAPGFPESAQQAGYQFAPYKSSSLWNYELGFRTEWLDRRLRWDTSFFYMDWKDLQLTIAVNLTGTNVPFSLIANVGRAHSEGVESSLDVIPFDGAHVTVNVSFLTAITDVPFDEKNSAGPVPAGSPLPGAPPFQWSTVMSYEHAVPYFESWLLAPTITYAYGGKSLDQIRPTGEVGGDATLDVRLALTSPSSRFQPELSLGVNNLTDVRGSANHLGGKDVVTGAPFSFDHYIQPRTSVLSVSLHY